MWWNAALRWNAYGLMKNSTTGTVSAGVEFFKLAVDASAKARVDLPQSVNSDVLDGFDVDTLNMLLKTFDPALLGTYGKCDRLPSSSMCVYTCIWKSITSFSFVIFIPLTSIQNMPHIPLRLQVNGLGWCVPLLWDAHVLWCVIWLS